MKVCVAQTRPIIGEVQSNIELHRKLIGLAASNGAKAVIFPELSLTGYEPKLAKALATDCDDRRFDDFQKISDDRQITIGAGMPIRSEAGILIGMILFQPHQARQAYFKQHLHSDEIPYFVPGQRNVLLELHGQKIAPAICYESLLTEHSQKANERGATIYVASVAKSARGVEKAERHFPDIARKLSLTVLMSNSVGPCDDFISAGRTAAWDSGGILVGQLGETDEGVVVFDTKTREALAKRA